MTGTGPGDFLVGDNGNATLKILSGAKVGSATAFIGKSGDNSGALVKDGPANGDPAWRLSGNLIVGSSGAGALTVDHAFVHVLGSLFVGNSPAGIGGAVLLQPIGILKADGNSLIGSFGQLNGSGLYACPFTQVAPGGSISPGVGVAGSVQFIKAKRPDAKFANYDAATDDLLGTLTIEGDMELQEGSILRIDVAGTGDGQFDILKIIGNATLNGILEVHFLDGFVPQPGQAIPFLQLDGQMIGQFSEIKLVGLPDGFAAEGRFINGVLEVGGSGPAALPCGICGVGICGAGMAGPMLVAAFVLPIARGSRRKGSKCRPSSISIVER